MLTAQVGINSSSVSSKMKRRCTREEASEVCALHKRPSAPKTNCEVSKLRHNGALPCSRKYPARKHFEAPRNLLEPEAANSAQTSPPSSCGWLPGCRPPANVREIRELQLHRASEIHLLAKDSLPFGPQKPRTLSSEKIGSRKEPLSLGLPHVISILGPERVLELLGKTVEKQKLVLSFGDKNTGRPAGR